MATNDITSAVRGVVSENSKLTRLVASLQGQVAKLNDKLAVAKGAPKATKATKLVVAVPEVKAKGKKAVAAPEPVAKGKKAAKAVAAPEVKAKGKGKKASGDFLL